MKRNVILTCDQKPKWVRLIYSTEQQLTGENRKSGRLKEDKKLSYRRVTARCVLSVVILPIATQQCRNYLPVYDIDLFRTCRISSFCTVAWQLARFQLTRRIARSLGDSWASCWDIAGYLSKVADFDHHTCIRRLRRGWPRSNFAEIFGVRKLESLDYRVVFVFMWSYVLLFY